MHQKHGAYYLVRNNKWTRLAGNLHDALVEYARLTAGPDKGALGDLVSKTLADMKLTVAASTFKNYTESTTYSLSMNNTSGEDAVMFAVFTFPFDFGISTTPAGWTKFADITDTADQQLLGFYKEIGTGVNTCSATLGVTVAYLAAGMILPYSVSGRGRGQAVAIF